LAINAVAAVTVSRAKAARVKNIVRRVKPLDFREREFKFVFIDRELLVVPV
jgi:hypothetical protein